MVTMSSQKFCKLTCGGKVFYLQSSFSERRGHGVSLLLCDTVTAWSGKFSDDDVRTWSVKTKMKQADYESLTQKALTADPAMKFEYDVKQRGADSVELVWKQVVAAEDVKFLLGSVQLSLCPSPSNAVGEIFEFVIASLSAAQQQVSALHAERDRLADERGAAVRRLAECATIKEDTERDLYSKFVIILNAKKEKLRQLKAESAGATSGDMEMRETSQGRGATSTASASNRRPQVSPRRVHQLSGSEFDTDEENATKADTHRRPVDVVADQEPSTSRGVAPDVSADISLVLGSASDDDNDEPMLATRQRKTTRRGAKQSGKPSMPQVSKANSQQLQATLSKTRSSTSSKGSLKRLSTRSSNNSSNVDTNDLLDHLA